MCKTLIRRFKGQIELEKIQAEIQDRKPIYLGYYKRRLKEMEEKHEV